MPWTRHCPAIRERRPAPRLACHRVRTRSPPLMWVTATTMEAPANTEPGREQQTPTINVTSVSPSAEDLNTATVTITAALSWTVGMRPRRANVTIGGNGPSTYSATSCNAPVGNTTTCTATYTPTTADTPGSYTESAAFSGDSNYNSASSSQSNNFTINSATAATTIASQPESFARRSVGHVHGDHYR